MVDHTAHTNNGQNTPSQAAANNLHLPGLLPGDRCVLRSLSPVRDGFLGNWGLLVVGEPFGHFLVQSSPRLLLKLLKQADHGIAKHTCLQRSSLFILPSAPLHTRVLLMIIQPQQRMGSGVISPSCLLKASLPASAPIFHPRAALLLQ